MDHRAYTHTKIKVVHFIFTLMATLYILYTVAITAGKETARNLVINTCDQLLHFLMFGMEIMLPAQLISRINIETAYNVNVL